MTQKEFRMSSGRFAAEMVYRYASNWLIALSLIGVAGLVLGVTVDITWLVVGLMVVFIALPMVLAFLYYYFGLRREAYVNTLPHVITPEEKGLKITLRLSPLPEENENPDEGEEKVDDKSDANVTAEKEPRLRDEFFAYSEMNPMQVGLKSVHIPLKAPAKGFIWIPVSAFESDDSFKDFAESTSLKIAEAQHSD